MVYAVVTGGSQGIGQAIAEKLLEQGCSVAITARNEQKMRVLQADWQVRYPNQKVIVYATDLGKSENCAAFATHVTAQFPHINILVNNAGTFLPGNITEEPEGRLEQLMNTNLYSAYYVTRFLMAVVKKADSGHIFNMCSVASLKAYPNGGSYSISKYALLGFSDNLREELRSDRIKVTSICPGATYSPSWEGSGVDPKRIMETKDIADILWSCYSLGYQANVEQIVMRPVAGDL